MHSKVVTRNKPGNITTHQVSRSRALFAKDNILPQEIVVTGSPNPRKLSVDSMIMQELIDETNTNMMAETRFGTR